MSARRRRKKTERKALVAVPVGIPRDEAAHRAQAIANAAAKKLPRGTRVVVVVTDASGEWVGVGSNTNPKDVEAILQSSLLGAGKREPKVIDVTTMEEGETFEGDQIVLNGACPHCDSNGLFSTLQTTTTARGEVERCWQCGGEYLNGERVWPKLCELCIDPIDKPHVDEDGSVRWRACPNPATRQVTLTGKKEHILNVCEEHFQKESQ